MNVPILGNTIDSQSVKALGPQIRLMICFNCKTIEELPDFDGPPDRDDLLTIATERHTDAFGATHFGQLFKVPVRYWQNSGLRAEILKQIREGSGGIAEIDRQFYESRSVFADDALSCYKKHLRPKGRCPDWKHDSKKLIPKTHAERKEAGLPAPSKSAIHTYLCDFCPAKTFMVQRARKEAGLYDAK